jgi:predicted transposase/invertase (TIGR01784 family)
MADIRVAREFFDLHLPAVYREQINLDTLRLCPSMHIDEKLQANYLDVLYQVDLKSGETAYLMLLAEHQSTPDPWMPYRILAYILSIWRYHYDQAKGKKKSKLPLVIPQVFYNGRRKYTESTDIRDLIQAPRELIDAVLFQPFTLIDVNTIPDEELRAHLWSGLLGFLMKHIHTQEILGHLQTVLEPLRELERLGGEKLVVTLLEYVLRTGETIQIDVFKAHIQEVFSQEAGEKIMTIAERFEQRGELRGEQRGILLGHQAGLQEGRQEGRQAGLQEGRQEGRQEGEAAILLRLLIRKFQTIPSSYRQRIEQADAETLLTWADQVFDAATLDEVFEINS